MPAQFKTQTHGLRNYIDSKAKCRHLKIDQYHGLINTSVLTDKKENKIFLKKKEIQMGSGAKSYMRKGFLICEKMRKYLAIYK
jgi:hypothetical protein